MNNHSHDHCGSHNNHQTEREVSSTESTYDIQLTAHWDSLLIEEMDCPTEERLIRDRLEHLEAIEQLEFNLISRVLKVHHRYTSIEPLQAMISELGMQAVAYDAQVAQQPIKTTGSLTLLAIAGVLALAAELLHYFDQSSLLIAIISISTIALVGIPTYYKGFIALKNKTLNINALMSLAVTGAVLIGQWPEAAMVIVLFTLAEYIEALSLQRARNAIGDLLKLAPTSAEIKQQDGSWLELPANQAILNDIIRVKPGQRIALDGEITTGQTTVDQAAITGESMPIDKTIGDTVFAGTINGSQAIEFKVSRLSGDTTLARIIHRVEEAQSSRAPTQRFVDQFAKYYTPIVVIIAIFIALITIPSWFYTGIFTFNWIYKALVLLVIACPCALVISTPVSIVSGLTRAARLGILIKGGTYLEQGHKLNWLAVDKTGTLTAGKPVQTDYQTINHNEANAQLLASSLAKRSDHPVSIAIANKHTEPFLAVEQFEALLGKGSSGIINDQQYFLGNYRLITELGLASDTLSNSLKELEQQGKTTTLLATKNGVIAIFAVADTVKETSKQAIEELHQLGIQVLMLTGDNQYTAQTIGKQLGIDEIRAELLPEDKLNIIEQKINNADHIGMVGDGINDTPALARANIGFAMGAAGTDSAIETADVALMDDDLRKLPQFIRLSKATQAILVQNISFSIGVKLLFLAITLLGFGTLWMAIFADIGVSLLVVFNGLRLLAFK